MRSSRPLPQSSGSQRQPRHWGWRLGLLVRTVGITAAALTGILTALADSRPLPATTSWAGRNAVPLDSVDPAAPVDGLAALGQSIHALFVSWAASLVLLGLVHLGGVSRSRRLVRRAPDERARNLDQAHEEETPRHVAEERLRIARALDSVTHSLASIAVQANVRADLLDTDPDRAEAALLAIKQTSGEALDDLRATLRMLRPDADADDADDTGASGSQPTAFGCRPGPRSGLQVRGVLPLRPPQHRLRPTTSTEEPP
jgi:signal transduction histidine kinase